MFISALALNSPLLIVTPSALYIFCCKRERRPLNIFSESALITSYPYPDEPLPKIRWFPVPPPDKVQFQVHQYLSPEHYLSRSYSVQSSLHMPRPDDMDNKTGKLTTLICSFVSSSLTLILPKSTSTGLLLFIWHGGIIIVPVMLIGISTAHKSDKKERNVNKKTVILKSFS